MTGRDDDFYKARLPAREDADLPEDLPARPKRIADPHLRRLVLAKIDALLSARSSKMG